MSATKMKIKRDDTVMVIAGKYRGQTGKVSRVLPRENSLIVDGVNVVKRHTKPSDKFPRGGILEITKPISVSKVMVVDPVTGKPARVGLRVNKDGSKERVFKASRYDKPKKAAKAAKKEPDASEDTKAEEKSK